MSVSEREERLAQELELWLPAIRMWRESEDAVVDKDVALKLWNHCLSLLERLEQAERSRDDWMSDAKRNEENRDYWKQRYETAQLDCCKTMGRLEQAEGIVRGLKEYDPIILLSGQYKCTCCFAHDARLDAIKHTDACPYRKAAEYLEERR